MSPPQTEEQRLASGRAALSDARRLLCKRPLSSPDIPAVPDPSRLPALVATLRAAGVPLVHAALRDWLRGLEGAERDMATALLAEMPGITNTR